MRITRRNIESVKPVPGKRQYLFDDEFPGFGIVVHPTGRVAFFYQYRTAGGRAGKKARITLGAYPAVTPELARREAQRLSAVVVQGQDPAAKAAQAREAKTVADVMDIFLAEHVDAKLKPSTARESRRMAERHAVPELGRLKVQDVSRRHVATLHHSLRATPYLANRLLGFLSKFFAWATLQGYHDDAPNPCRHVEKFREVKRERFLTGEELTRVGEALAAMEAKEEINPLHAAALRLLVLTGARLSEVLDLEWAEVDLDQGLLRLAESKTGRKAVHLGAPAVEILRALPRFDDRKVFPSHGRLGRVRNLRRTWILVCEQAGLEGVRLHDLRHSFASVAASSGHSLPMIGAMLGHTQPSTTQRYAHVAANPVHQAAEDTAARIAKALSGSKIVQLGQDRKGKANA